MKLRRRVAYLYWFPFFALVVLGVLFDRSATTSELSELRSKLSELQKRIDQVNARATDVSEPTSRDDFPERYRNGKFSDFRYSLSRPRPRLLGRGSSGNWVYSDLRLPSGEVRRYFARKNSTLQDMAMLLANIRADVDECFETSLDEGSFQESSSGY